MPRMVAIVLVAGLLTSACGTTSRQVQPTAADLQTIKRLAVVVTGDDPFRVVAERAEGPGKAAKAAAVGGAVGGVVGGLLGYAIGYFLFDTIGRPILEFYHAMDRYDALKAGFDQWGTWIIIIKGMTPIPYKLITIASGVAHFDLASFIGASIISRSLRFFLVAAILWQFGDAARRFIERRLTLVTSVFAVGLVGGFVVLRYL